MSSFYFNADDVQMMYRWVDSHVDLNLLVNAVKEFFEKDQFETRVDKSNDGWIVWAVKRVDDNPKSVSVKVYGEPKDFCVEFSALSRGRTLAIFGSFMSFFGLGALVQRETQSLKFFEGLEEKFWVYMENAVNTMKA